jgi:hypothetical protein
MALGSTQPLTEMSTRNLPGGKGWPARTADILTTIRESIVWKTWEPRPLITVWASTACYRDSFTFAFLRLCTSLHMVYVVDFHTGCYLVLVVLQVKGPEIKVDELLYLFFLCATLRMLIYIFASHLCVGKWGSIMLRNYSITQKIFWYLLKFQRDCLWKSSWTFSRLVGRKKRLRIWALLSPDH